MSPLSQLAENFQYLAQTQPMTIRALADACDPVVNIINQLNAPAAWAGEITAKVGTLRGASNRMSTLRDLVNRDRAGRHALQLVRRSIEAIKVLAEELLGSDDVTLEDAARNAYYRVFHEHHDDETRNSAYQDFNGLPDRGVVTFLLGGADVVNKSLREYVAASKVVIRRIDALF